MVDMFKCYTVIILLGLTNNHGALHNLNGEMHMTIKHEGYTDVMI